MKYSKTTKLVVFLAGFVILSIQIIGFRILVPYTGSTSPVWASVIGITLLGSALGYYIGGAIADKTKSYKINMLFGIVSGLLILAILPARILIPMVVGAVGSYAASALVASFLLFLLPILGLGSLITFTIRRSLLNIETVARVHGDLYAIATVGSIAGVFATSYIFIPFASLSTIVVGLGIITFLSPLLVVTTKKSV